MGSLTDIAKEKFSLPPEWEMVRWQRLPHYPNEGLYHEITGAVYPPLKTGKNKGQPNYKKPVPGTKATVVVTVAEHRAWLLEWERKTGLCHDCHGSKEEFAGWNHLTGTRTKPCRRCNATGKNPALTTTE